MIHGDLIVTDEDKEKWPHIEVSEEQRKKLRSPWKKTLIVKLLGKSLGFNFIYSKLRQKWAIIGDFSLIDLGKDYYIAR